MMQNGFVNGHCVTTNAMMHRMRIKSFNLATSMIFGKKIVILENHCGMECEHLDSYNRT